MNELFVHLPDPSTLRVNLTVDVAHERARLLANIAGVSNPEMDANEERRLLSLADILVAITESDAGEFRKLLPDATVITAPKACEPRVQKGHPLPGRCLFVGSGNEPNRVGLEWFLSSCWPIVRKAYPNAQLNVCGTICESIGASNPGVCLLGKVPDLSTEYQSAEVVIIPLLSGSGMKIKLVEASCHAKACVTTSVGLQGMPFLRDSVLCEDTPVAFAAAIVKILGDTFIRYSLEHAISKAAGDNLSKDACYRPLACALAEQTAAPRRR